MDPLNTTVPAMVKYANLTQKHAKMAATQTIMNTVFRTPALYRATATVAIRVSGRIRHAMTAVGIALIMGGRLGKFGKAVHYTLNLKCVYCPLVLKAFLTLINRI